MQDKRRYKRYNLDLIELNGKMSLTDKVEILDISMGGVALKADRRLNIGKEYVIKLQETGKTLDVRGIVVRSELSGMETRSNGDTVTIYTAGMIFKEGSADKLADFLLPIQQSKTPATSPAADRRMNVRFHITTPMEKVLHYPAELSVKAINLGGMLINTDYALAKESLVPMSLSLDQATTVNLTGRVVSCQKTNSGHSSRCEIGVEFKDLREKDKKSIIAFIDYLAGLDPLGGK